MAGVFLSYAREDLAFVRRLHEALAAAGRDPVWDQDHAVVPFGAPYPTEIAAAIAGIEKFIFVISPDSLGSRACAEELAEAKADCKQIIALLRRQPRESQPIPEGVAEPNWIFFNEDAEFDRGFGELIQALDTDLGWAKEHARLLVRAREWEGKEFGRSALLRGADLRSAETWLADGGAHPKAPPTDGQRQFIIASRRAADRATRLQRSLLAVGLAIAIGLASVALIQRDQAIRERDQAIFSQTVAEALQASGSDAALAAQLDLAADHMQQSPELTGQLIAAENTPLFTPVNVGSQPVESIAFSADSRTMASASGDGKVQLWGVSDPEHPRALGKPLTVGGFVPTVAFSPNGDALAGAGNQDGTVQLWNVANPARPRPLSQLIVSGGSGAADAVAFSPDGRVVAVGYGGGIVFWDVTDLSNPQPLGQALTPGLNVVTTAAFSSRGHTVANSYTAGIQLWDLTDPQRPRPLGHSLTGNEFIPSNAIFSHDGRLLASGSLAGTIQVWDVSDPSHARALGQPQTASVTNVATLAFSPDDRMLGSGDINGTVRLWNTADPAHLQPVGQPLFAGGSINALAFSPNGRTLATGGGDGTIRLWRLPQTIVFAGTSPVAALAFSPKGHMMADVDNNGMLRLWDATDPADPRPLGQPVASSTVATSTVAFSPDGRLLAEGDSGGTVRLWDLADPVHPRPLGHPLVVANELPVLTLAFSPDGHILATSYNSGIRLWDVTDPAHPRPQSDNPGVMDLAFSPNGHIAAEVDYNGILQLWDVTDPARPRLLGRLGTVDTTGLSVIAFSPDGRALAWGGSDSGVIRLWDITNPIAPKALGRSMTIGNASNISNLAFSPDGGTLAIGDYNGNVQLLDVADLADSPPPLTVGTGEVNALAFSPDGHSLVTGDVDGILYFWQLNVAAAKTWICATTGNVLTPQQWQAYIPQLPYQPPCPPTQPAT